MTSTKYATKIAGDNIARAMGRNLAMSTKDGVMICNFIRKNSIDKAKRKLKRVIEMKSAVSFTRFNRDLAHKPGIGPGRYPIKACKYVLGLVESAEANAKVKGLDVDNTVIVHTCAHKASRPMKQGRHRGEMKRTNVEVVVKEKSATKKKVVVKKEQSKPEVKEKPKVAEPKKEVVRPTEDKAQPKVEEKIEKPKTSETKKEAVSKSGEDKK